MSGSNGFFRIDYRGPNIVDGLWMSYVNCGRRFKKTVRVAPQKVTRVPPGRSEVIYLSREYTWTGRLTGPTRALHMVNWVNEGSTWVNWAIEGPCRVKVAEDDIAFKLAILKKSLHLNDNTCFCSIIQSSKLFWGSLLAKNNFFVQFWT